MNDTFFPFPTEISLFHYVEVAIVGLGLFVLFYLLKRNSIQEWLPRQIVVFLQNYLPLVEVVVWGLYILYAMYICLLPNPWLGISSLLFVTLLGWPLLRNFVSGLWIKSTKRHSIGQIITIEEFRGTISKLANTTLHIENDQGETLILTYAKFLQLPIIQESPSDRLKSYPVELYVKKKRSQHKLGLQQDIFKAIMALPWAVGTKLPYVEAVSESADSVHFRIVLYGIAHGHLHKIETFLHKQFSAS